MASKLPYWGGMNYRIFHNGTCWVCFLRNADLGWQLHEESLCRLLEVITRRNK